MLVVTFDNTNGRFVLVKTMETTNYNHIAATHIMLSFQRTQHLVLVCARAINIIKRAFPTSLRLWH